MSARFRAFQLELRAANDNLAAEIDVGLERFPDIDNLGLSINQDQHIRGKSRLHCRVFIKVVQYRFRLNVSL